MAEYTHMWVERKKDAKKSTTVGQINQLFVHIYESGKGAIFVREEAGFF